MSMFYDPEYFVRVTDHIPTTPTNAARRAGSIITSYESEHDRECLHAAAIDLLADLIHWFAEESLDWSQALAIAETAVTRDRFQRA